MECEAANELMSAWIDRQILPGDLALLEAHLAGCPECRAAIKAVRAQDADLMRAFQPRREAAHRVAGKVLEALKKEPLVRRVPAAGHRWGSLALAAAAGFVLAVLVFQPWKPRLAIGPPPKSIAQTQPRIEPPIATFVSATGTVEMRPHEEEDWHEYRDITELQCPALSGVRTGPNVRCELKTPDGCVIRLNKQTEITLAAENTVEIQRGQIWCSSPENVSLKVVAAEGNAVASPPSSTSPWSLTCPSASCMMTSVQPNGGVQVTTSKGETVLVTSRTRERLKSGESASIVSGEIIKSQGADDPLLAANWIDALLIRKDRADEELAERVDQLLARMGQAKLAILYEQQVRGLGEHAALPLLRYVQSPISRDDPPRRYTAMRILGDIAPYETVPDLIQLLADQDADTRVLAAATLQRLTGVDQGRTGAAWRESLEQCQPSIELWRAWWREQRGR